ncbi:MAG TPA: universal stress protein [Glaciihabitans sp.]|nr:universal stress protein [Glaciihabitans sp.]
MNERVVVGLNGKPGARFAMYWALYYARPHKLDVELVHVVEPDERPTSAEERREELREAMARLTRDVADAKKIAPDLRVTSRLMHGTPAQALSERSEGAKLVVIGSTRLDISPDVVHSTGVAQLAAESECSVVVVPQTPAVPGTGIVVGVDGSDASLAAVSFAAEMADRQRQTLTVVFAQTGPPVGGKASTHNDSLRWPLEQGDDERLVIAEAVAGLAQQYPDLIVRSRISHAEPVDALYLAARNARMVVVGSHGLRGRTRYWMGSTSYDLVLTMPCVVAVIKADASRPRAATRAARPTVTTERK